MNTTTGSNSSRTGNPWSSNLLGARLGDPNSGLTIARRHGLLQNAREDGEDSVCTYSSVKMIKLLKEISQLNSELQELELKLHKRLLDKDMADLTHVEVLKSRLAGVDCLLSHLTEVVRHKEELAGRLQSGSVQDSLKIEAPYQKHLSRVLTSLGPSVSDLPSHCSRLHWTHQLDLAKTNLEDRSLEGSESLVQCRATYQTAQSLHNTLSTHGTAQIELQKKKTLFQVHRNVHTHKRGI